MAESLLDYVAVGATTLLIRGYDPVTSRARQREQAAVLVAGRGKIVAEFFDSGQSRTRTLPWARRPQAAALVAALADPDRGWDAIVIGEYGRAFYGDLRRHT